MKTAFAIDKLQTYEFKFIQISYNIFLNMFVCSTKYVDSIISKELQTFEKKMYRKFIWYSYRSSHWYMRCGMNGNLPTYHELFFLSANWAWLAHSMFALYNKYYMDYLIEFDNSLDPWLGVCYSHVFCNKKKYIQWA